MRVRVLGSSAGGGFPQWNCGCANCHGQRFGSAHLQARTQESLAISADDQNWILINASPDIHRQIESFPELWPRGKRHSPITGIVLTNGDMDHVLGLLSLRESHPLTLYATASVRKGFTEGNSLYRTLERFPGQVVWKELELGLEQQLGPGLRITSIPIPGKDSVHLEAMQPRPTRAENNIGVLIREEGDKKSLGYFPAVAGPTADLRAVLETAETVFFDGTFWSQAELVDAGLGEAMARDMAHWPVGGPDGSLAYLSEFPSSRRIFTHLNNSNPMLGEDSPEHAEISAAGLEVAYDGLDFTL